MSGEHTPGPWSVSKGCDQYICADGQWIAATMGVRGYEGAVNARLIAAAPDMLAALHQYANDLRYPPAADSIPRRLAMVEALIKKASGHD